MFDSNSRLSTFGVASVLLFFSLLPLSGVRTRPSGKGLASFPSNAPVQLARATYTARDGLAGNYVTVVALTDSGEAWIGTTKGVTRISDTWETGAETTRIQRSTWTIFTRAHGLGDDWITAIAEAPDKRVWLGTQSGGISVFDPSVRKINTYNLSNSLLSSNMVTSLVVDSKGIVWIGTLQSGIVSFDPAASRWTSYRFANNSVTALALDSSDAVWAGTDGGGAFRYVGGRWMQLVIPGDGRVKSIANESGRIIVKAGGDRLEWDGATWNRSEPSATGEQAASALGINAKDIDSVAVDSRGRMYVGTRSGLGVLALTRSDLPQAPRTPPLVLVHGWTVAESDTLEDSEFRFLKDYAEQDGIAVFYAKGISPKNTLFRNAEELRDDIAKVRKRTGADKVNLLAFSMGGLNARAYLESSIYAHDVNRVIILGTPQAGVDIWKPFLARQILDKPDQPSAIELTPEYARLFNQTHSPRASVPYDLLIGDARNQSLLGFIAGMPANDGLIGAGSALSLAGPNVRRVIDDDLHAYNPTSIPFKLTSYLYPRDTYDRYLRNALRDQSNAPIGSEVQTTDRPIPSPEQSTNHTPVVTGAIGPGATVTRTVTLDANLSARFLAYFPGGDLDLVVKGPDAKSYENSDRSLAEQALGLGNSGVAGLKADIANFVGYSISKAKPGNWQLVLKRRDNGTEPLEVTTYVDLDAPQYLRAGIGRDSVVLGESVTITATLSASLKNLTMTADIAVSPTIPETERTVVRVPLRDSGNGTFTATFIPPRGGYYLVTVNATGDGFTRGTEFLFGVNPGGANLNRGVNVETRRDGSGKINSVNIVTGVDVQRAGKYAIGASLRAADGRSVARISFPVDLDLGANRVSLAIDPDDFVGTAPYALDLVLMDTNSSAIQVDGVQNVAIIQP